MISAEKGGGPRSDVETNREVIRIILADADTRFMDSVQDFLTTQPHYEIVARVSSCMDAVVWCEELSPQILILDWHLMFEGIFPQDMTRELFLQKIKGLKKPPGIIVASRLSLDDHRNAALAVGADEFMPKAKFPQLLRPIIQRLAPRF